MRNRSIFLLVDKFSLKTSSPNVGCVFAYFCGGQKNNFGYNFVAPWLKFGYNFVGKVCPRYQFQALTSFNQFYFFVILLLWWDIRGWNIELALVCSLQIRSRKYSVGKCVWHRFKQGKNSLWDSLFGCLWNLFNVGIT